MALTLASIQESLKKIPPKQKILIICGVYLLLAAAYYFSFLQYSLETKGTLDTKLSGLQTQVEEKERLAAQKNKYIRELSDLKETLKLALTKLPDKREIPGLLYSVAQAGKETGVDFILFEPSKTAAKPPEPAQPAKKPEDVKGAPPGKPGAPAAEEKFYEEIPVNVSVNGSYHNIAVFFEKVAKLPRIVNVENISMSEVKGQKGRGHLVNTTCVIKTYMFLEKMEEKKADEKKAPEKK